MGNTILDSIEEMKAIDCSDMLSVIEGFSGQCREAVRLGRTVVLGDLEEIGSKVSSILILGMGGSGVSGDIAKSYLENELRVPLLVNKSYGVPGYVNENTLVFAVSYSGDTEETLSGFDEAVKRNCKVVSITTGGKLAERANDLGFPVVKIPAGIQPRSALGYLFLPLLVVLSRMGFVSEKQKEIEETISLMQSSKEIYGANIPVNENIAKGLALRLYNKLPVIYGFSGLSGVVAFRWKCQFNENSKIPSFWHVLPELNHNETVSWECLEEITRNFTLILLRDKDEPLGIKKRFDITRELIEHKFSGVETVWAEGKSKLARMFSLIYLGDFVSYYLALLYGVDPSPVERIKVLKDKLAE